uniref:JmjC domain-containing protein n=1 Tax=Wuchereria bancrofti TaxID=6293 RepID=A0AAF5Q6F7_WUCBA
MIGCEVTIQDFDVWKDEGLLQYCCLLCREVFCQECVLQELSEIDAEDKNSRHTVVQLTGNNSVIGICLLHSIQPYVKLEQVAKGKLIRKDWRGRAMEYHLCRRAIELAQCFYSRQVLVTYSHHSTLKFYEQLGFMVASDEFRDAGILHKCFSPSSRLLYYFKSIFFLFADDVLFSVEISYPHCICGNLAIVNYTPGDCFDTAVERIEGTIMSFKAQNILRLVHLQHLPESGCSLIRIYKECSRLENFLVSVAWEKLNTGCYEEIDEARRVFIIVWSGNFACDMGLIMGRDVDGFALSNFAHHLHSSLSEPITPVSLKTQKLLQPPPPVPNSIYVDVCELPSFEEMLKIIRNKKPVVVTRGLVNQWPAFRKWNFLYFNELIGHRTVPIEIGNSYADSDRQQVLMTFRTFIQKLREYLHNSDGLDYLAQHRSFDQIPELLDDIIIPDYCSLTMSILIFGFDMRNFGRKFLRIIPATETENMYPRQDGILTSTSQVCLIIYCFFVLNVRIFRVFIMEVFVVLMYDLTEFPRFCEAHVFDCTLYAGDCLFIPAGFWHYVFALDPSISMSCWSTTKT